MSQSVQRRGPHYYTRGADIPIPEKSASYYLGAKRYNAEFESYYENDYKNSGFTTPFLKYQGPGNSLNLGEPVSEGDLAAKRHDVGYAWQSYRYAKGKTTQAQFAKNIERLDSKFISENAWYTPVGLLGKGGIGAKSFVESVVGKLYPGNDQSVSQFETGDDQLDFVPYTEKTSMVEADYQPPTKLAKVGEASPNLPVQAEAAIPDIEMASLTGTGKEQASGGASSDGMMVHEIPSI